MSQLTIFEVSAPNTPKRTLKNGKDIASTLGELGIRFERWKTHHAVSAESSQDEILDAYASDVSRLKDEYGFQTADVVSLSSDHPKKDELRAKFLDEHIHTEDEVRFFVRGRGLFYIHAGDRVYALMCEKEDLISVPANTPHWFDMGPSPEFTCIRLFTNPEGWVAQYKEDSIAGNFPTFEQLGA